MAVQAGFPKEKARKAKSQNGIITATRTFQVKVDRGDGELVVGNAPGIPREGSQHPELLTAYCNSVELDQQDNGVEWFVVCQYSSEREMNEDPTLDPVEISWDGEIYTEAIYEDINGDAIVNSAGDYFVDPSPTKEKSHLIASIVAQVSNVPAWVLTYRDVVNDAAITIDGLAVDAKKAFIQRPKISKKQYRNDIEYRTISYDVHIHPDGWKLRPMDVGFRAKNADAYGTQREQIVNDGDGEEPTTPVPLDGSGYVLSDPTPSTVVFLDFDIHEAKDFSALPGIQAG